MGLKKLYADGLGVTTAAWTAQDKILVGVHAGDMLGKTVDGYTLIHGPDVGLRLIDPTGKEPTKGVWFPAVPDERPHYFPWKQATSVDLSVSSFSRNLVALGDDRLVDGETLNITSYYTLEKFENGSRAGGGGKVFSPDGQYLYIKDAKWFDNRKPVTNAVIDTSSGRQVALFAGGDTVIAIKPDGGQLAIGNHHSVQLLSLH